MKILLSALLTVAAAILATCASAEQRRFYDSHGKSIGTSSSTSEGTTTFYDSRGNVTARATKNGDTTTLYDSKGKNLGKVH